MRTQLDQPKIALFHGLNGNYRGEKYQYLSQSYNQLYAPDMNYLEDPYLFDKTLTALEAFKPDILVGNSMGGWFAYLFSTFLGTPTLLFNPALHGREPFVHTPMYTREGTIKSSQYICVLGIDDTVIDPLKTITCFKERGILEQITFLIGHDGHEIPQAKFQHFFHLALKEFHLN